MRGMVVEHFRACPACGGKVHAIARRCKHCRAELPAHVRSAEPAHVRAPQPERSRGPMWAVGAGLLAAGVIAGVLVARGGDDGGAVVAARTPAPALALAAKPAPRPTPVPPAAPAPRAASSIAPGDPTPSEFVGRLAGGVCTKLEQCATTMDPSFPALCQLIAGQLGDTDLDARVRAGECTYDGGAARRCLTGLEAIDCNAAENDPLVVIGALNAAVACVDALDCTR